MDKALARSCKAGLIRKLARGLYDYPRTDVQLGTIAASTDDIAKALKGRDSVRLQAFRGARRERARPLRPGACEETCF